MKVVAAVRAGPVRVTTRIYYPSRICETRLGSSWPPRRVQGPRGGGQWLVDTDSDIDSGTDSETDSNTDLNTESDTDSNTVAVRRSATQIPRQSGHLTRQAPRRTAPGQKAQPRGCGRSGELRPGWRRSILAETTMHIAHCNKRIMSCNRVECTCTEDACMSEKGGGKAHWSTATAWPSLASPPCRTRTRFHDDEKGRRHGKTHLRVSPEHVSTGRAGSHIVYPSQRLAMRP